MTSKDGPGKFWGQEEYYLGNEGFNIRRRTRFSNTGSPKSKGDSEISPYSVKG